MVTMMRKAGRNFSKVARELNGAGFRTAQGSTFQLMHLKGLAERLADVPGTVRVPNKIDSTDR